MEVEFRIEELDQLIQRGELGAHAGLIADEVAGHTPHETDKGPECDGVVLHDGVEGARRSDMPCT